MIQPKTLRSSNAQRDFIKGVFLVLIGAASLSTKSIFVKLSFEHGVDGTTALMFRMIFALPYYVGVLLFSNRVRVKGLKSSTWTKAILVGLSGFYLASIFDFVGLQYVQANLERLIVFMYPTFVLILAAWIFRRVVSRVQIIAVTITYLGIVIAFLSQDFAVTEKTVLIGTVYIILSAFFYSIFLVFSDDLIRQMGTVLFNSLTMLAGITAVLIHYFVLHGFVLTGFDWQVYMYGILMAIIATIIPTLALTKGISLIGSSNAAILSTFGPIVTISMSYFILHEPFSFLQGIGTILVLVGVLFLSLKGSVLRT